MKNTKDKYTIIVTKSAAKTLKKYSTDLRNKLKQEITKLKSNPHQHKRLKGEFKQYYSVKTIFKRTHYRIIFSIEEKQRIVIILVVGSRENLYNSLKDSDD